MANDQTLHQVKDAIGRILTSLKISKVIYIDDIFEAGQDVERVIGWFSVAFATAPEKCNELIPSVPFNDSDNIWRTEFRKVWEGMEIGEQQNIIAEIVKIVGEETVAEDLKVISILRGLFPRKYRPIEKGPSTWSEQEEVLLNDASEDSRILCLFDQDLSLASTSGFTSTGTKSGIGLLKNALTKYSDGNVIYGLLTHTLNIEDEIDKWEQFSTEIDIPMSQFLPLSKHRVSEAMLFVEGIKVTTLNLLCNQLKTHATEIMQQAFERAKEQLAVLNVYHFNHMVLNSSLAEGVWEADTLLRIHQIFQRDFLKELFLDPSNSTLFNHRVQIARSISLIKTGIGKDHPPNQRWLIRHQELYEDARLVNQLHSPLEVGDLFALDSENEFILIAQPCDLITRSNGKRNTKVVPLIPIKKLSLQELKALRQDKPNYFQLRDLLYYFSSDSNIGIVDFPKAQLIQVDVLDLAVFNPMGHCRLDLTGTIPNPLQHHLAWQKRRDRIIEKFKICQESLEKVKLNIDLIEDENVKLALWQAAMPKMCLTDLGLPTIPYSNGVFDFGLRRIGRYRQPGANRVLKAYTRYLSREAEEHDFV